MEFEYLEPTSVEEAVSMLFKYEGKTRVIAGGTDLVRNQIREKTINLEYLIDLGSILGLAEIRWDEQQWLSIGALTTLRSLERSPEVQKRFPVLSKAAGQLGSVAIRNLGTVGGNLCNAAPSAEMAPSLIGLSAMAKIMGPSGGRGVPLEDFFTGPGTTVLRRGELLTEIQVPAPKPGTKGTYLKHGARGTIDLAIVGVAVIATLEGKDKVCKDIRIVLGAVAPTPMMARKAAEILKGKKIDEALINQSAEMAANESRPISDVRASEEYRREMVKVFTRRAIREVIA